MYIRNILSKILDRTFTVIIEKMKFELLVLYYYDYRELNTIKFVFEKLIFNLNM